MFQTSKDLTRQKEIAEAVGKAWDCKVTGFGDMNAVDYWFEKYKRCVAVGELKDRPHSINKYPTVFLSMRKWMALHLAATGMGVKGLYIVQFTDHLMYVDVYEVDAVRHMVGGRTDRGAQNDIEPLIEVPIGQLRAV